MEKFIEELERERVEELERERVEELDAYLRATGLKNYELTQSEKSALAKFDEFSRRGGVAREFRSNDGEFKEFCLGDLFDVENTWIYGKNKNYITRYDKPSINSVAVISGITTNNGVNYYTNDKLPENEIFKDCLTISTRGEYSGTVTYHSGKFVLANNILVMPMPNWSNRAQLFIATAINALNYGGYSNYPKKETLKNDKILLPTLGDEIDYKFMNDFIKAIEKLVIKDVVLWADKKIEATKNVINK